MDLVVRKCLVSRVVGAVFEFQTCTMKKCIVECLFDIIEHCNINAPISRLLHTHCGLGSQIDLNLVDKMAAL